MSIKLSERDLEPNVKHRLSIRPLMGVYPACITGAIPDGMPTLITATPDWEPTPKGSETHAPRKPYTFQYGFQNKPFSDPWGSESPYSRPVTLARETVLRSFPGVVHEKLLRFGDAPLMSMLQSFKEPCDDNDTHYLLFITDATHLIADPGFFTARRTALHFVIFDSEKRLCFEDTARRITQRSTVTVVTQPDNVIQVMEGLCKRLKNIIPSHETVKVAFGKNSIEFKPLWIDGEPYETVVNVPWDEGQLTVKVGDSEELVKIEMGEPGMINFDLTARYVKTLWGKRKRSDRGYYDMLLSMTRESQSPEIWKSLIKEAGKMFPDVLANYVVLDSQPGTPDDDDPAEVRAKHLKLIADKSVEKLEYYESTHGQQALPYQDQQSLEYDSPILIAEMSDKSTDTGLDDDDDTQKEILSRVVEQESQFLSYDYTSTPEDFKLLETGASDGENNKWTQVDLEPMMGSE